MPRIRQLDIARNILFLVVLGIDFQGVFFFNFELIISFPTNQLYLTNPSPKPADPPINTDHIHNTYTPPIHTPNTYHPSSQITVHPNQPYRIINIETITIPARANIVMTIPCTLTVPEIPYSSCRNNILSTNLPNLHL